MTKVRVLSERFTLGKIGDIIDVDPQAVSVRQLVKARIVELVPDKKKTPAKKPAKKATG